MFDIRLLNAENQPVVTVETKEPGHITAEREYKKFLGRLKHYPSLRHAYLTNGSYWERYDLHTSLPEGEELTEGHFEEVSPGRVPALFEEISFQQKVGKHHELAVNNASAVQAEEFFAPLSPSLYVDFDRPAVPAGRRHKLSRNQPHLIEGFSEELRESIADFREFFFRMLDRFRAREVGSDADAVYRASFQLWCERSYIVPLESLHKRVERILSGKDASASELLRLFTVDFGFAKESSVAMAESLYAEKRKKNSSPQKRKEMLWPLYEQALLNYATQTTHVYVARLLLYRIGEDQQLFEQKISGSVLQTILAPPKSTTAITPRTQPISLTAIEALRTEMAGFAPTIYESGEFDWWQVHSGLLQEDELERLQRIESELDVANQRVLRLLARYDLSGVDLDIWRDIYQHYLPDEERQQLGGFYTPQELVDLTLDYANYKPTTPQLCQKSLIDLASGSGAFIASALQRLLLHLNDKSQGCHAELHAHGLPEWKRSQLALQKISPNIHAIDIHPFAAFLTYINFLFVVLPLYAKARWQRKSFRVAIFSDNSLLTPGENAGQRELDLPVNSRIQRSRYARELYRQTANQKFDFVVGNPPWGGILKGRLAPIFDQHYKEQLAKEYPDTYTGKLDIYGLFYDRALKFLKPGGTVALVTQGSFIDKEWAGPHTEYIRGDRIEIMGLRRKLAEQASLRYLIDLNPFGQLFFGAMNIPCIAVFEKRPAYDKEEAVVVFSGKKSWPKGMDKSTRRGNLIAVVRRCLELVEASGDPLKQDFVSAFRFPLSRLRGFQGARWLLAPKEFKIRTRQGWHSVAQLLEPSQGVTVGGEGGLSIFLMPKARAEELELEKALVHRIVKGHETTAWRLKWEGNVVLYPYHQDKNGRWVPAFACHKPPVLDALDFEEVADKWEQDWVRKYGYNSITYKRLLEHRRDALDIVKYPKAAEYLLSSYDQLSGRTFKKRNVRDFNREWYEFIWPRDAGIILAQPKIISPRLTPKVRFALDQEGLAIQDSCICLAVSENTKEAFNEFRKQLRKLLGREVKAITVYRYLLAFLNSSYAQDLLTTGRRPTPKGHFQIDEQFLQELSIPVCRTQRELQNLLDAVEACMLARTDEALEMAGSRLNSLVPSLYAG